MLTMLALIILGNVIDAGAQQGWSHIAAIIVGGFGAKAIDYLGKRLDSRVKTLEEKVTACEEHRADCATLKTEHAELKARYEELLARVDRIRERADLHHPEDADATGEHTPLGPR